MNTYRLLHPIQDAAWILGLGRSKLYNLIADGEIRTIKIGRRVLISQEELERYVKSLTERSESSAPQREARPISEPEGGPYRPWCRHTGDVIRGRDVDCQCTGDPDKDDQEDAWPST